MTSLFALYTVAPLFSSPDITLNMDSLPTKGSTMVLNTKAEKGSSTFISRLISSPVFGLVPLKEGLSHGEGRKLTTSSNSTSTPTLLTAEPHSMGTISPSRTPCLIALVSSSMEISSPSKYFSINSSLVSTAASTNMVRIVSTSSTIDSGMGASFKFLPSNILAFILRASTKPLNSPPSIMGI